MTKAKKTENKGKKPIIRKGWGVGKYDGILGESDDYYFICPTCGHEHKTMIAEEIEFIKKKLNE